MDAALEADVKERAQGVCEYCRLPEACQRVPFQIDHIIAEQHEGATVFENLANACLRCNKRKGPNVAGVNSNTGEIVRLFIHVVIDGKNISSGTVPCLSD